MKCPKCSYVSFDYNLSCPKCNKDISAEQARLNFPAFRPETPFLLGGLTGESGETHTAMSPGGSSPMDFVRESAQEQADSPGMERDEITFEESEDLDLGSDEGKSPLDTADFELGREEKPVKLKESPIEDLSLETDSLAMEHIDEDDFVNVPKEVSAAQEKEEAEEIDLDSLELDSKAEEIDEGQEGTQLSLDDLKVSETGELEIGAEAGGVADKALDVDELTLDEIPLGDELSLEESGEKADAAKAETADEGDMIDLDDLGLDLDLEEEETRA